MTTAISPERPDSKEASALIEELEAHLASLYPSESRHGYSVDNLLREGVAFFVIRVDSASAGCGGVKLIDNSYGEIKRMYIRPEFRGRGLGKLMLGHLTDYARSRGIEMLRLETGIYQQEAIGLYERAGFKSVPPFGEYKPDPNSLFFEKEI